MTEVTHTTIATDQDQLAAMLALLAVEQARYAKARGRKALSQMIADAYVCITTILATVDEEAQANMLSRFQIDLSGRWTSMYGPWIAAMFGEHHIDATKTKPALDGEDYRVWQPNASMAVYSHTMEELLANGVEEKQAEWIMKRGGSQTVANLRKKRLADRLAPDREKTQKEQVDLFLAEATTEVIAMAIPMPEGAGAFVGLIAKVLPDNQLMIVGVSDRDASAKLTRMAATSYEGLKAAKLERDKLEAAKEAGRREARAEIAAEAPQSVGLRPTIDTSGNTKSISREMIDRVQAKLAEKQTSN